MLDALNKLTFFHLIIMRFTLWLVPHLWLILSSFHHLSILQIDKSFFDKSWRFCLIFPICFVYSIWKPDYLIQFDSIAHAWFLSISPTKNSYQLPFTISSPTHHKATHPQVNSQPLCRWWLFHFERALSRSELARFLILKIWFVGYLGFLVSTTSA